MSETTVETLRDQLQRAVYQAEICRRQAFRLEMSMPVDDARTMIGEAVALLRLALDALDPGRPGRV